ncbi:hypothetical protein KQX54_016280 [Cotesia glomerata]|uniref:Uncharacterized protein n=1 Tax=Cotesia glomerata TaxID=32391 RepID=A0AAV7IF85_COTGL|nr:hypothetical protein KQX54_016280 [Cotesia glomerata]
MDRRLQGIMIDQYINFNLIIPRYWHDYFNGDFEDLINHIRNELITIVLAGQVFRHPFISIGHLGAELILDEPNRSWRFQAPRSQNQIYVVVENGAQRIFLNMDASIINWGNRIDYHLRQEHHQQQQQHLQRLSEPRPRNRAPQAARRPRLATTSPQPGPSQQPGSSTARRPRFATTSPQPGPSQQQPGSNTARRPRFATTSPQLGSSQQLAALSSPPPGSHPNADSSPPRRGVSWDLPVASSTPQAPRRLRRWRAATPPPPPPPSPSSPPSPSLPASLEVAAAGEWAPPSLPELDLVTPPKQRCEFCNANPNSRRCLFPDSPTPSTATTVLLSEEERSPLLIRLRRRLPSPVGSVGETPSEFSDSDVENDDTEYFNNNYY